MATCKNCNHFNACSKWTDFPNQCGVPVCARFEEKSAWISVDERLPETEEKYLVCTTNGNIGVGSFIDYYGKGTHLCFDCWAVTHWMPLPEPPKGSGNDKQTHGS